MRVSIRGRLTFWYTAILSLVLAAFAVAFYALHARGRLRGIDDELARASAVVERSMAEDLRDGVDLATAAHDALEDSAAPDRWVAVFDASGRLLAGRWPVPPTGAEASPGTLTMDTSSGRFRALRARHQHGEAVALVAVAEPLERLDAELTGLRHSLGASFLLSLLLAAAGGSWIARAALRPLKAMAGQARLITERTPGERLQAGNPSDELGVLAASFNDLLGRLQAALAQQRQFMADASHELRTPVSVARTAIEVTLGAPARPEQEYRDALGIVGGQMRRLTRIVEDLFTLARADAAGLRMDPRLLYVDDVVGDCLEAMRVLAEAKGVRLTAGGACDCEIRGDERWLRHMLVNLIDNAIRHTPVGGSVVVDVQRIGVAVEIAVRDGGIGIPEADRERVFERFVQLDSSRHGEGSGLGLPIARTIAEAHGGTLALAESDGSGSIFVVRLPGPAPA